uniref:Tumor susceptibility gene 101 protein-like n=1 Tax=Phallusia mammillata TaxID=59560 RepID=A0A6F9DWP8_9ASCI|nr:tumor susceptibility gene 101 protein-like [Phallusia mammillata]
MPHPMEAYLRSQMQGKYNQPDAARQDALNLISHYKDLKPSIERFIFNDGSSKNLVCLKGTIPVVYKGTTYNIPVALWLQEAHPQVPPLCFVQPTSTMQVRQGKHVDSNGRIYLPYLTDWRPRSHNLVGCVQVMAAVFSEEPPVFAKPAPGRPPPPQAQPYPAQQRTPYPGQAFPPQGPPTTNYRAPTPYPTTTTQQPPYPSPTGTGYPPYSGYPQPNQMSVIPTAYPPQSQAGMQQSKDTKIEDSMIKASLLSAVNEKLKRRLKDTLAQAESETQALRKTESELKVGQEKIDGILKRLELEINDADANRIMLQQRNDELTSEIDKLQQKQDNLDVDDVVMATTPVYRQIVTSFAEEQALEDTIYYLSEALHKDVVDVDTFLKHVRALSRQQFMLRAVIQKARKSAGLANVY